MGCAKANFFGPAPWGPGEGSKGQISFNFNFKVNFQRFLYQTLGLFSQTSDVILIFVAWVMPQGSDFGALEVPRGSKFFFSNMVTWHIKSTRMTSRTGCK